MRAHTQGFTAASKDFRSKKENKNLLPQNENPRAESKAGPKIENRKSLLPERREEKRRERREEREEKKATKSWGEREDMRRNGVDGGALKIDRERISGIDEARELSMTVINNYHYTRE
ncbi:MAG: hypothetical protein V8Q84_10415 [Bilophila sp.]